MSKLVLVTPDLLISRAAMVHDHWFVGLRLQSVTCAPDGSSRCHVSGVAGGTLNGLFWGLGREPQRGAGQSPAKRNLAILERFEAIFA